VTSVDVLQALRARYAPPEWYLLTEVQNGTGYQGNVFADAVAVSAFQKGQKIVGARSWYRFGAEIHGFEIKITRGDFLAEVKNPKKSEAVQRFCDRWWLVTQAGLVEVSELPSGPPGWGLIEVKDGVAKIVHLAPKAKKRPVLTEAFVASLVRRASQDRGETEALKGALLKAPLRQVAAGSHSYRSDNVVLVCGHVVHRRPGMVPKAQRCLGCVDKLPPAIDLVYEALRQMNVAELRKLGEEAMGRAERLEKHGAAVLQQGGGLSPTLAEPRMDTGTKGTT
jgi:hypothetical protein